MNQGSLLFLEKKKQKNFIRSSAAEGRDEVFWFFFAKKNRFFTGSAA